MKILVADDDPDTLAFLQNLLEAEGYDVATASGGEEALSLIRSGCPDLVILDATMPYPNGWIVNWRLTNNPMTVRIPVLMLAHTNEDRVVEQADRQLARSMGVECYLTKPFNPEEFLGCVRKLLTR